MSVERASGAGAGGGKYAALNSADAEEAAAATGLDAAQSTSSQGSANWTRVGVLVMMVWVFATVFKESGAFSSVASSLALDTSALRGFVEPEIEVVEDMRPDSKFVYRHSVLDKLEKQLEAELENGTIDDKESGKSIHHIRNMTRLFSTLPRTSDIEYNALEPKKKYLLYSPSGGFNNQLICLVNAMTIAKRIKRVLIVPMNGKHSNLYRGFLRLREDQMVPMDHTLDFHHMQKVSGLMMLPLNVTINEFIKVHVPSLKIVRLPPEGLMKPKNPSVWREVVAAAKRSSRQVVWLRGRFFSGHWLNKGYWENARYAPYLQELAASVANDFFQGNFNAFHIRMGDYATRSQNHAPDASKYLSNAIKMGFKKEVPIYVASEEGRGFAYFEPLIAYFDKVVFQEDLLGHPETRKWLIDYTVRTPSTPIRNDLFGLVDQLICTRAHKFIGTKISTFSKTIRIMRKRLSASVPELFEDLTYKAAHNVSFPERLSGMHRWAGGGPEYSSDTLR